MLVTEAGADYEILQISDNYIYLYLRPPKAVAQMGMDISYTGKQTGTLKNNYFSTRVVNLWVRLDEETIYSDSVELYKIELSKFGY